jgi:undecaprenyl-diphosphatase
MKREFIERQLHEIVRDWSAAGSFSLLLAVGLALLLVDRTLAWALLVGLTLVELVGGALKLAAYRVRPDRQRYTNLLEKVDSGSFPSIHAARAAMTLTLVYLRSGRPAALVVGIPVLLLIGGSRILLKRHYLADVIVGAALGIAAGWLLFRILLAK